MDSLKIVQVPVEELIGESWEGTLRRLTADMDPWDIDITLLARRYRATLRTLEELSFVIPGRMVVTCSILLRMKSDALLALGRPTDQEGLLDELEAAIDETAAQEAPPIDREEFSLPLVRRPRRRVTLQDLRQALAGAMKVSRRRAERLIDSVSDEEEDLFKHFELGGEDISDRLRSLVGKIKRLLSGRRFVSFFRLLERGDKEERVRRFIEVLHLAAQGEIACTQEEFLGDILISRGEES
jgi:chromatin segregation and condensation protein Rec8/ScpA/Scc1 (kleisin family)